MTIAMEVLNYRERVKRHHLSKRIQEKYSRVWVAKEVPRPNYELPHYASKAAPFCYGSFISSTSYIDNSLTFLSKEAAERFIKGKKSANYEPHQFNPEADYA